MTAAQQRSTNVRPIRGQAPPHDIQAEATVLSDLILKPEHVAIVRGFLQPSDFFDPALRLVAEAVWSLDEHGEAIDTTTVAGWLRSAHKWRQVGFERLRTLVDETPAVYHFEAHARIVADKAALRRALEELHRCAAEAYGPVPDVPAFLESVSSRLSRVARESSHRSSATITEAAGGAFRYLQESADRSRGVSGVPTHLEALNDVLGGGLHAREVTLVTAETGGGKSALVGNVAVNVAGRADDDGQLRNGVLAFTLEMPGYEYSLRWACSTSKSPFVWIRSGRASGVWRTNVTHHLDLQKELPIVVNDEGERRPLTVDYVISEVARQRALFEAQGKRLALVVLDYAQLIDWRAEVGKEGNAYTGLDAVGQRIKSAASEFGCPWLVPAQLNKAGGIRDCPKLSMHAQNWWDLRGAKGCGWDVEPVQIHIKKQRHGATDLDVEVYWHGPTLRFTNRWWDWQEHMTSTNMRGRS